MTTYEKCLGIRRIIMNRAAEIMVYDSWSSDFCASQIKGIPQEIPNMKNGEGYFDIQPADLSYEEMIDLGFGQWSKENKMRLIPLWLFPFLAEEIEVECINGEKTVLKKKDMDTDNRFGCLAYGIAPGR